MRGQVAQLNRSPQHGCVSDADREKWDRRYADVGVKPIAAPSAWLTTYLPKIAPGPALDLACGRGRNALLLARHGFSVDAIDISAEGLRQAEQAASRDAVSVNWLCRDVLEDFEPTRQDYQLILMVHFMAPELLQRLPAYLAPGGWLLVEQHLRWPEAVGGPSSDRFRVASGEILSYIPDLTLVAMAEGKVQADSGPLALSRVLMRR